MIKVLQKQTCLNDDEFILKVSSHNCRCYVGFEKDVEYNIDVEFNKVYNYKIMYILVYYKTELIQAMTIQIRMNELYYKHL